MYLLELIDRLYKLTGAGGDYPVYICLDEYDQKCAPILDMVFTFSNGENYLDGDKEGYPVCVMIYPKLDRLT